MAGPMWRSEEGRSKPGKCWQQEGDVRRGISDRDSNTSGCSTDDKDADCNYGTEGTTYGLHLEVCFHKVIKSTARTEGGWGQRTVIRRRRSASPGMTRRRRSLCQPCASREEIWQLGGTKCARGGRRRRW